MIQTVPRKRIEILVDTPLVPRIVGKLKAVDISGWSLIHVDSGGGRAGQWQHDDVTDAIAPLLDSYGMLLTVGDVQVVRGERF
jgi:hypothetical protein